MIPVGDSFLLKPWESNIGSVRTSKISTIRKSTFNDLWFSNAQRLNGSK